MKMISRSVRSISLAVTGLGALAMLSMLPSRAQAPSAADYIWIEGENTSAVDPATFQPPAVGGPPGILSGDKWLAVMLEPDKIAAAGLGDTVTLSYNAAVAKPGDYDVWMRLGYEQIRSPFDWRIDQGAWQTVPNTQMTVDVQEIGVWAPVGWADLGKQTMTAGAHTLQIRINQVPGKDGKPGKFVFALDAICLATAPFHPDGALKPGDASWMTDADKAAQNQTFEVPVSADAAQISLSLAGPWQYAGDDEFAIDDRLGPTKTIPSADALNWHAIDVPGDRNAKLPRETYVHRFYLRTRVKVPSELAGRSFLLHIPGVNMIGTVFVNGQQCGWTKNNLAVWDCDLTSAIKPGQMNEICVAIKDAVYGMASPDPIQHARYIPYSFWTQGVTGTLDMPVVNANKAGFVLNEPSLVVGGSVYTGDVFPIASVKDKTLGLEVTLHNPGTTEAKVQVANEVQPLAGGAAEKTFASQDATVPAGQDLVIKVSEAWANPKLWWPDDPQQYNVVTRISLGGKVIDERKTKFGFREWTWNGTDFKLNGIAWHGFADVDSMDIAKNKEHGQNMVRVWSADAQTEAYLDECDAKGMAVRRTGIFDGETASYRLNDNPALWDNYRAELQAFVKGQRNHPSIFIWSIENEITFINGHVRGQDALTTTEMKKAADLITALDPTRPLMTDGGNANLEQTLPVYGGHYMEPPFNTFPEGCYDNRTAFMHRQVWPVLDPKPILLGEAAYTSGNSPAEHATVGGEQAFLGPADARPAVAMELRMLSEGYRWDGINFHFWSGGNIPTYYKAWQPLAVLSRQWDWTFGSGEKVPRTMGIFNDTRSTDPITFAWNLTLNGQKAGEGTSMHTIDPGENEKFDFTLPMPIVTAREEGVLTLTLSRGGKTLFEDTKDVSVLPSAASFVKAAGTPEEGHIALFDPNKSVDAFLTDVHVPFTSITDLANIPATVKVLIIGKDAITPPMSTSSQLAAWASAGHSVIVLEQTNQLKFQALPGQMEPDTNAGCLGFPEDSTNPILNGLLAKDFMTWGPGGFLYRNAYVKPISGGRSIIQCDLKLADSPLVQMQAGDGILILSQLLVAEKIKTNAVAQQLLLNMISYGYKYKLRLVDTSVVADDNPPLLKALDATGLKYEKAPDVLAALAKPGSIAVVNASAANLKTLATNLPKVQAFTTGGGWIVLNNLTPDGLADFNTLVGVNHLIRHLGREKISWPPTRDPLTTGLSAGNIVLGTGKQIVVSHAGEYPDQDAYSYVVDLDDAAPFATSTYNMWNNAIGGFTMADGEWRLIQNLPPANAIVPIKLARPEKILQFVFTSDLNYAGTTKIQVSINGKDYPFDMLPTGDPQTFDIPDQPTASELTFKILDWQHDGKKGGGGVDLVGIDNIRIKVARTADFYNKVKPMLNIGAMVDYPQGKGGIILCNVMFKDSEQNPINVGKKQAIITAVLRNLNAAFSGGKTIIAGGNLSFTPIDISKQANQFRDEQGWFGDKAHTFAALPSGKQTMAGVTYNIYHFTTSPVPEAIMLGGKGVPGNLPDSVTGIPVNQKADALFFLQAARLDKHRSPKEAAKDVKYEMADYVVHYADGKDEKIPLYSEISMENYVQDAPAPVAGAQIAWVSPYTEPHSNAVAYSMQWNNPRPDVAITSIDLVYADKKFGVPAVLAITAATAQ